MTRRLLTTTAALACAALAAPAQAWTISIHYKGSKLSLWITLGDGDTGANYDAITHTGIIPFTDHGPYQTMDIMLSDVPGLGGLPVTLTGDDFHTIMGEFAVDGGLGTTTCDFRPIGIWVTGDNWGYHIILINTSAALALDGFNHDGGLYSADGLAIPIDIEVHRPDGSTVIVSDVITEFEFESPLDLTDECPADCDGNGELNLDDLDCFISGFLGGCA